jgi:hypothetical protein|nr:MAG: replication initiator protein [Microviridae sp.]
MPCFHPITAYRSKEGRSPEGVWPLVFNKIDSYENGLIKIQLPCGTCIGCKYEKSRQWAIRCVFEASLHQNNCFITLTYSDNKIPINNSLPKVDFILFIKKLRKKYGQKIKFYMAGEYGKDNLRPHYHACIFNHDFMDKQLWKIKNNVKIYTSEQLNKMWGKGYTTVGEVNFESAAYIARYCCKESPQHHQEIGKRNLEPEYNNMSRRPGVASDWFDKYKNDIINTNSITLKNGVKIKIPRFFNNRIEKLDLERYKQMKKERREKIKPSESTYERLSVKEEIQFIRHRQLTREYENA